jgi:hypothetical protein
MTVQCARNAKQRSAKSHPIYFCINNQQSPRFQRRLHCIMLYA